MSDPGQPGLRRPVKSCTEESTYPARTDAEGKTSPPLQTQYTTEFDMEGRLPLFRLQCPAKGRKTQWTLPLIVSFVSIITNASGQDTEFRMETNLVNVFVSVTDSNGSPVGGLVRQNFELTEDGRTQEIAIFERTSELPIYRIQWDNDQELHLSCRAGAYVWNRKMRAFRLNAELSKQATRTYCQKVQQQQQDLSGSG